MNAQTFNHTMRKKSKIAIAIHGGASNIEKLHLTREQDSAYRKYLNEAVLIGYTLLKEGKSSLDAVQSVVTFLEDNPLFNAGKGSVLSHDGGVEMDAAIMDGLSLKYGAVCGVKSIKNPIQAARLVMDSSKYVMLSGSGAEKFAENFGLNIMPKSYFETEFRKEQWKKIMSKDTTSLDNDRGYIPPLDDLISDKFGTVGAVAIDLYGNLASATSTGGIVNKKFSRIGDSPIGGAGTYANNSSCAVSCTGHGEEFMRLLTAFDISCLMQYKHFSLQKATEIAIMEKLVACNGRGGCIAVDKNANISIRFTTTGMFRAFIDKNGLLEVKIFKDE